ncbi:alpha/beta-hydrolase [Daldinia vernicosa]|uniref:alpha/beta-hydrolase n=1 Tax=Daldinia vernicosa TaxID=114800 RepID=UPI0020088A84|nr:alpha/beta-hydrolase [Daldinia vernicosa]KAI0850319.1 alpha/beta-hydrolase [Daldinia vernicosa]
MESTSRPTLLLLHGAFHIPDSYNKFTRALRAAGFEVHVPRLPSMNGSRPPNTDLATDSELVRSYATSLVEAGRDVAVLMHSYGGQVGTNSLYGLSKSVRSANGLPGGISHLIYMSAFALPEGKSMIDKVEEFGHLDLIPVSFGIDSDQSCVTNYPREGLIDGPSDQVHPEEIKEYIETIGRWNGKSMYMPIQNTPAWRDEVNIYYMYTLNDISLPIEYQRSMVEFIEKEEGKTVETVEFESNHALTLLVTKRVVDTVIKFTS